MNEIKMIPIEQLAHHPENPRLDLGDLTELTASIKANGILQNLTVVFEPEHGMNPDEWAQISAEYDRTHAENLKAMMDSKTIHDRYLVVIGNRRLEASKAAGLTELPCSVREMTHQEQIATMLQENMQRSDLTVYEQAKGIQMMMDLGFDKDQIAERTGFSKSTIDRRLAVATLPEAETKSAVENGIDLLTLVELSKVEDREIQEKILSRADGLNSSSLRADIKRAVTDQERKKIQDRLIPEIKSFAKPLKNDNDRWSARYEQVRSMTIKCEEGAKVTVPEDAGQQTYYYWMASWSGDIEFFRPAKKEKKEKSPEEIALARKQEEAKQLNKAMHERRIAFCQVFAPTKKLETELKNKFFDWAFGWRSINNVGPWFVNYHSWQDDDVRIYLDMPEEEGHKASEESLLEECKRRNVPFGRLLLTWMLCGALVDASRKGYCSEYRGEYQKDQDMDRVYEVLAAAGYQLSEEEQQWKDGTHPIYPKKDARAEDPEEDPDDEE